MNRIITDIIFFKKGKSENEYSCRYTDTGLNQELCIDLLTDVIDQLDTAIGKKVWLIKLYYNTQQILDDSWICYAPEGVSSFKER